MDSLKPVARPRLYETVARQIVTWMSDNEVRPGDRLPPERELAVKLGVSRATISQALVAMEVVGAISVRHGDGAIVTSLSADVKLVEAIREHAQRLPDILDARDALESKLAALAAERRTEADMAAIDAALDFMLSELDAGERGVDGDERFHAAVTQAAHSQLLAKLMGEISGLIRETRVESLGQPGRPRESMIQHRTVAEAIRAGDPALAAAAMHSHLSAIRKGRALGEG
ncbi:FadR/GntR family transcriptional regulator [Arthrobacter sp. NPDC090010]|uniref:FadR/GntR family transcriptional regulator n=1 Tax=Arthrobacter sp. NPDC090010 TaxID=3363942 RepID=UPI00380CB090